MNEKTNQSKCMQSIVFLGIGFVIILLAAVFLMTRQSIPSLVKPNDAKAGNIDLSIDRSNPQETWALRLEESNKLLAKRMQFLEKILLKQQQSLEALTKENTSFKKQKDVETQTIKHELVKPREEVQGFSKIVELGRPSPVRALPHSQSIELGNPSAAQELIPQKANNSKKLKPMVYVQKVIACPKDKNIATVGNSIPAGTSVKAVLVSGLNVPCAVSGFADPQPVKLRILEDGYLYHGHKVKLKGGIVVANAVGDLSNERVYMRLEKFTKVNTSGEVISIVVSGCVLDHDGNYGVKGVVGRKAAVIGNDAIAGLINGFNEYMQTKAGARHSYNDQEFVPYDAACCAASQELCSSFDQLSKYCLERAEQSRPAIQVAAGQIVDIFFTHEATFGATNVHQVSKENSEKTESEGA